jgi:hypothetical protein
MLSVSKISKINQGVLLLSYNINKILGLEAALAEARATTAWPNNSKLAQVII